MEIKQSTQLISPGSFTVIKDIPYFRLENGNIAVEKLRNVTINTTKDDVVELVTLQLETTYGWSDNKVRFWLVNNEKIFALTSSSYVDIPKKNLHFLQCISTEKHYEDSKRYITYSESEETNVGVLYVSETEVGRVIDTNEKYCDVISDNSVFYAESIHGDKHKYHIINRAGKLLGEFDTKCKKVDNYQIFYDENKIIIGSQKIEISGKIESVEVKQDCVEIIRVVSSDGISCYSNQLEYLLGPIKRDRFITTSNGKNDEILIYGYDENDKLVQCVYATSNNNHYDILCDKNGIIELKEEFFDNRFFFASHTLYALDQKKKKFTVIEENIYDDYDDFKFLYGKEFKNTRPKTDDFHLYLFKDKKAIYRVGSQKLYFICNGFGEQQIYKAEPNRFFVIDSSNSWEVLDVSCDSVRPMIHEYYGANIPIYLCEEGNKMFFVTQYGKSITFDYRGMTVM